DSVRSPAPQPSLGPLRLDRTSPFPMIAAVLIASGSLLLLVLWRRRGPRRVRAGQELAVDGEVPDARWLAAGERARPNAPLRDQRELLLGLDQVAFATAHRVAVAPLAARARALARELSTNGEAKAAGGKPQ